MMCDNRPQFNLSLICFCIFSIFSCRVTFAKSLPDSIPGTTEKQARYFRPAGIIVPSAFLVYGCLKPVIPAIENLDNRIMENIQTNHPDFSTRIDDYLQWAPSVSIYAMDALKVKTKHRFIEHLAIDAGSIIITGGAGFIMRKISGNMEVYNSKGTRFPSGHTANAFRGAEIVFQELKDTHRVMSYSGYLVASAVGVLRIYNKAHFLTEVLAGAGLGILSTKLTYLAFDKVKSHKKRKPH
ncbi:MAG: phosphatase PAP2 family protein [Chitinophagaceae bacterium]